MYDASMLLPLVSMHNVSHRHSSSSNPDAAVGSRTRRLHLSSLRPGRGTSMAINAVAGGRLDHGMDGWMWDVDRQEDNKTMRNGWRLWTFDRRSTRSEIHM